MPSASKAPYRTALTAALIVAVVAVTGCESQGSSSSTAKIPSAKEADPSSFAVSANWNAALLSPMGTPPSSPAALPFPPMGPASPSPVRRLPLRSNVTRTFVTSPNTTLPPPNSPTIPARNACTKPTFAFNDPVELPAGISMLTDNFWETTRSPANALLACCTLQLDRHLSAPQQ